MTQHKNTTLELTVDPNYVPDWGLWEAVRELLQNAFDADDKGHKMTVKHKGDTLTITNEGVDLKRDTLLLGHTSKADDVSQRGKFGEGYKLALTVLSRLGKTVVARTNHESWTPAIEHSQTFGTRLLKIRIRPATARSDISFRIDGVSAADWEAVQARCLPLQDATTTVDTYTGRVLLDPQYRGQLFADGIYVSTQPDFGFGYDLKDLSLDRDRKLADPWSLRYQLARLLRTAFESNQLDLDTLELLLSGDGAEAQAIKEYYTSAYHDADALTKQAAKAFRDEHGDNAVPVASTDESVVAAQLGLRGVIVSPAKQALIGKEVGDFAATQAQARMRPAHVYGASDLSEATLASYNWATELVALVEDISNVRISIVDFFGDTILGTHRGAGEDEVINLAHRLFTGPRGPVLSTLVHEVAHRYGADGTAEHREAIERIFGTIVQELY